VALGTLDTRTGSAEAAGSGTPAGRRSRRGRRACHGPRRSTSEYTNDFYVLRAIALRHAED
jgi:hypothetical protein